MLNTMSRKLPLSLFTALIAAASLAACNSQSALSPASFDVTSLTISPETAIEGQEVTVTASIINIGGMPGNFDEPLLIDGSQAGSKVTTIQPGITKTITYSFAKNQAGTYTVSLHNANAILKVVKLVEHEMELKYDDGTSRTALWAGYNGGFLVEFNPPVLPYRINKIRICGGVYGMGWEGKTFDLFILDSDMKSVLYSQTYAISRFPVKSPFPYMPPEWVDFEIPPLNINGKFHVYLYTSTGEHKGIQVGVDDSVVNEHSQLCQGKPPYLQVIPPSNVYNMAIWYADITKVTWMIRTVGVALVPEN